jgi:hypothetical protein
MSRALLRASENSKVGFTMKLISTRAKLSRASLSLIGVLAFTLPSLAQNTGGSSNGGADQTAPEKTGVGARGSKVAPSTDPGLASHGPTSSPESKTGVGVRGSKVGPSTEPPASNQK